MRGSACGTEAQCPLTLFPPPSIQPEKGLGSQSGPETMSKAFSPDLPLFLLSLHRPREMVEEVTTFGVLWPDLGLLRGKGRLPRGGGTQARYPQHGHYADENMEPK